MPEDVIVRTPAGQVKGVVRADGTVRFRGIPYAQSPLGPMRFAAPAPMPRWDGVWDATFPAHTAPRGSRSYQALDLRPVIGVPVPGANYLSVSVTTPDPSAKGLPVLVFVHGGAFQTGSPDAPVYDGAAFARDGVVLVSVGYRLGFAGWLDLPDAPANRGLLDVLLALRWVQDSIQAFGGDPMQVTLAGESAGAVIAGCLLPSPAGRGLFARVISQSGGGDLLAPRSYANEICEAAATALGCRPRVDDFSEIDDETLCEVASGLVAPDPWKHGFQDSSIAPVPLRPVVDGEILTDQPTAMIASGKGYDIDLLAGANTDEANMYFVPAGLDRDGVEQSLILSASRLFAQPESAIEELRRKHPDKSLGELESSLVTDCFAASTYRMLDAHAAGSARTYGYEFGWRSPAFGGQLGACHSVELPFMFDELNSPGLRGEHGLLGAGEAPSAIASAVHAAWVSFIKTGTTGWQQHTAGTGPHLLGVDNSVPH